MLDDISGVRQIYIVTLLLLCRVRMGKLIRFMEWLLLLRLPGSCTRSMSMPCLCIVLKKISGKTAFMSPELLWLTGAFRIQNVFCPLFMIIFISFCYNVPALWQMKLRCRFSMKKTRGQKAYLICGFSEPVKMVMNQNIRPQEQVKQPQTSWKTSQAISCVTDTVVTISSRRLNGLPAGLT